MNSIQTIDCHYYTNEFAAAYLMREGEEGLFVDNNTNSAIPYLQKLKWTQISMCKKGNTEFSQRTPLPGTYSN
ncbi:MAG: hypothetical protein KBF99_09100 [Leptospiraceae bacterium]|nr:hypothetical protein [Leptospiraceae bacterium]MBK7057704.1 hypothetical protein [Leptospiraceae bacterium]MBK9497767.1 hypothetical protein [Leptospiraceae bacterium]MBK9500783.1 hypothetical protein [Leptospiraceae bacterium]MBP9163329.1 hypothetical protein [Leptospiraceae bacterium]